MGITGSNRRGKVKARPRAVARRNAKSSSNGSKFKLTIPSDLAAGREVQRKILDSVQNAGFEGQDFFAIKLALEEAVTNAIKHGNKFDPKKQVRVEAKVSPKQCEIVVEDQGPGFDRKCVPDPTLEENIEKCSGRGILLMEAYMNSIKWTNGGRRVRMVKKNDQAK